MISSISGEMHTVYSIFLFGVIWFQVALTDQGFHVYDAVPGLEPSPFYNLQIREAGADEWLDAFTLVTECTKEKMCDKQDGGGFYNHLANWSNSYVNFEIDGSVEVEVKITKLWGDTITKAVMHPSDAASSCEIIDGEAIVTVSRPTLFAVDINGQMDDQDTGKSPNNDGNTRGNYDGPPIHTVTIFANPPLRNKPNIDDDGVYPVGPGEMPPEEGAWHTLFFLPGLHDIGHSFTVHQDKSYYIPGDAVVYGTMNNEEWFGGRNVTIFGHGTLSGDKLPHPSMSDLPNGQAWRHSPIHIEGAEYTTIEGITIGNSAMHSIIMYGGPDPVKQTTVRWVKIFTWRPNGDGINPFENTLVEDCFIRTQDDSTYVNGPGIRRVVYWQDCNGSTFVLSPVGGDAFNSQTHIVEDCTVIYSRATWNHWSGGNLFNMRGEGQGEGGYSVTFRNIVVEDPRPTLQHFKILMEGVQPWSNPAERKRGPGDLWGITFENINIKSSSVLEEPEVLWGMEDGLIRGLIFKNVTLGGQKIEGVEFFQTNEFVFN